jgi:epoxyqueuosine reductase
VPNRCLSPRSAPLRDLTEEVKRRALALGFARVGIARAGPLADDARYLASWLEAGYQGTLDYMRESAPVRANPTHPGMLATAKSVVALATPYESVGPSVVRPKAGIAGYARRRDYHPVLYKRLGKLARVLTEKGYLVRRSVDSMPVLERAWARLSGIGFVGKNALLVIPGLGSYLFLSSLITDAELEPDTPIKSRCGRCRICLESCPTGALVEPQTVDARRCIAYLTMNHRGPIEPRLRSGMGGWIFGCDVCQKVCPFNHGRGYAYDGKYTKAMNPSLDVINAVVILQSGASELEEAIGKLPLRRAGRDNLARNAAIALGNTGAREHLGILQAASASDPSPVVREHAQWAIERIEERFKG